MDVFELSDNGDLTIEKQLKNNSLLDRIVSSKRYMLVLQDELSAHTDVQICLISRKGFEIIDKLVRSSLSMDEIEYLQKAVLEERFFNMGFSRKVRTELAQKLAFTENLVFDFSGESPMLQLLRLNFNYRKYETLFLWALITSHEDVPDGQRITYNLKGNDGSALTIRMSRNAEINGYVLCGPAFVSDDYFQWNTLETPNLVGDFSDFAAEFLPSRHARGLIRMSSLRSVISFADSDNRFKKIEHLLSAFSRVRMLDAKISKSLLRTLIRSIITSSQQQPKSMNGTTLNLPLREAEFGDDPIVSNQQLNLYFSVRDDKLYWECDISRLKTTKDNIQTSPGAGMSELSDRAHTNATDQRLENLLVFRNWLYSTLGKPNEAKLAIASDTDLKLGSSLIEHGAIAEAVACSWLRKTLRCDVVTYFRADHSKQTLFGVAVNAINAKTYDWANKQIKALQELGQTGKQQESYLYRSISDGSTRLLFSGKDINTEDSSRPITEPMTFLKAKNLETPRSALVLPVHHGDRVLGVIECSSFEPFAFDGSAMVLIEEFTQILAQHFLALADARLVGDINDETVGKLSGSDPDESYNNLAQLLAKYFLCYSVSIWRPNNYNSRIFELKGQHNRFENKSRDRKPSFNLTKTPTMIQHAIKTKRWLLGKIGSPPFDKDWETIDFRKNWVKTGIKYIAIIPVIVEDEAVAAITLGSKNSEFSDMWGPQFEFCADVIGNALKNVATLEKVVWDGLSDTNHELKHIANTFASSEERLSENMRQIDQIDANTQRKIQLSLGDISRAAEDLDTITEVLEPESFMKFFSESSVRASPLTYRLVSEANLEPISVRNVWNQQFENIQKKARKAKLFFDVTWLAHQDTCEIDRKMTASIFRNLLANAIKYSPKGTTIEVECEHQEERNVVVLKMENIGPSMTREEVNRIFERRFRGFAAEASEIEGLGEGLYQAKIFARRQKANLSYRQTKYEVLKNNSLHRFTLTLPCAKR